MQKLKLGVIGLGNMGKNHLRVAGTVPQLNLVGGFDTDVKVGQAACTKFQTACYRSIEQLIEAVDALVISAPTLKHFPLAQQCLKAGKHLLVEKPLSATKSQAQQLERLADRRGVVLQVGHVERFNPVFRELRKILKTEKMIAVEAMRMSPFSQQAADVSVTFDLLIHDLDLVFSLIGGSHATLRRAKVSAVGTALHSRKLNYVNCQLRFPNGVLAHLTASKITQEKIRRYYITCADSFIVADFLFKHINIYRHMKSAYQTQRRSQLYQQSSLVERVLVPNQESVYAELQDFAEAVLEGRRPEVPAADGVLAIEFAERIEKLALRR